MYSLVRHLFNKLALIVFTLALSDRGFAQSPNDWIIEPGVRIGPITNAATEVDLFKYFGSSNVISADIHVGEGYSVNGAIVFMNDPEKKIEILWKDQKIKKNPVRAIISGQKSLWRTHDGISLGTSLKEIEKMNEGPFNLSGFGWGHGGGIRGPETTNLKTLYDKAIGLRMHPKRKWEKKKEYYTVIGEQVFASTNPVMQMLNPSISSMKVNLYRSEVHNQSFQPIKPAKNE